MKIYAVYWPEGGAVSQYSVVIGQYMPLISSYWPEQVVAYCDMREDRNFKSSDMSRTSVLLLILTVI